MLDLLDQSLETFLRAEVPLTKKAVDISFEAPDKDWGAGVTKPTVNLYLWDVRRNLDEREAGWQLEDQNGRMARVKPKPRMDFRYLVTAWTSEISDEHALLGAVLGSILQFEDLPERHLQGAYGPVRPLPSLLIAAADGWDQSDFWAALGGQLKPGLDLVVTATVDALAPTEVGPPVERYDIQFDDVGPADLASHRRLVGGRVDGAGAGTMVRSPRGRATTGPDGEFLVPAEPGDEIVIETPKPVTATVGDTGQVPPA